MNESRIYMVHDEEAVCLRCDNYLGDEIECNKSCGPEHAWMYRCCTDPATGEKYGWGRVLDYIGVAWEDYPIVQMDMFMDFGVEEPNGTINT